MNLLEGAGVLLILGAIGLFFFNPVVIVPAGHRGVIMTWGEVGNTLGEGIHFRVPVMQSVVLLEVRTQKYETDASSASSDLQIVHAKVALNYHIDEGRANEVYRTLGVGWGDTVIAPAIQEALKATTAKHTAEELITQREVVKSELESLLKERLRVYNIFVETVSLTNFDFSAEFNSAIEQKVSSQQKKLNEEQILLIKRIQAEQAVAEAQGLAQSRLTIATADANATLVRAEAESKAVRLLSEELNREPRYIQYMQAQKWDGRLPLSTGGALPLLNLSGG